jgi:TPR repeat protein
MILSMFFRGHHAARLSCGLLWCAMLACTFPSAAFAADKIDKTGKARDDSSASALRADGPQAATPEQVAADPAAVWARFLDKARLGEAYKAYDLMDEVGYNHSAVDADACRDRAARLREAVAAVPVSIALHRVAMMCADAIDDEAWAERETLALAALSKHALAAHGDGSWRAPIRVLSPRDVYALLGILGYEFRYEYYAKPSPTRYFPLTVAAWDAETKVERHLSFDFIDATYTINRADEYSGYPVQRSILATAFHDGQREGGDPIGADMVAVREAYSVVDSAKRIARLREGGAQGGLSSLLQWVLLCELERERVSDCGDGLIDALLPLAEREQALAMTLLAFAHAEGMGVARDTKAAEALLDAADRRWHARGASVFYAALNVLAREGKTDPAVTARLRRAAEAGHPDAEALLVSLRIAGDPKVRLSAQEIAVLERPASNGTGAGHGVLVAYYTGIGQTALADAARRRAAEAGHALSQRELALRARRAGGERGSVPAWRPWLEAAAHSGDAPAMLALSEIAQGAGDWKAAEAWLLGAVTEGDIEAQYAIAKLYETGHRDLSGTLADAIETYESLAALPDDDGNEARRRLATFAADGRGMKRNLRRARTLLLPDAERGVVQTQTLLAGLLVYRGESAAEIAEGERWFERAVVTGADTARNDYALWLHAREDGTAEHRRRGLALLRAVGPASSQYAATLNNLAWLLCVSPHADTRDAAAGMAAARELERTGDLPPERLDTLAACHAASGDSAAAVRLQQRAIDGLPRGADGKSQGNEGMFERLALYRAGKAYIENP